MNYILEYRDSLSLCHMAKLSFWHRITEYHIVIYLIEIKTKHAQFTSTALVSHKPPCSIQEERCAPMKGQIVLQGPSATQ